MPLHTLPLKNLAATRRAFDVMLTLASEKTWHYCQAGWMLRARWTPTGRDFTLHLGPYAAGFRRVGSWPWGCIDLVWRAADRISYLGHSSVSPPALGWRKKGSPLSHRTAQNLRLHIRPSEVASTATPRTAVEPDNTLR